MKTLDLFAGIGGFRLGFERAGFQCAGFCEWDRFARKTYKANFNTKKETEFHDVTRVADEQWRQLRGKVDIITGGFPCQAFSVAGKRRGFEDTRGTLFFEILRAARAIMPRYLVLENVRGLLSHGGGDTFQTILLALSELGYFVEWQILNSKNFGVPQNRERVFIVGHLGAEPRQKIFPIAGTGEKVLKQLIGGAQGARVYSVHGVSCTLSSGGGGMGAKTGLYVIPVLTPDRLEKRQNGRRFKEAEEPSFALTSQDRHGVAIINKKGQLKKKNTKDQYASTLTAGGHSGGNHSDMDLILEKFPCIPNPDGKSKTIRAGGRSSYTKKHCHDIIYDGIAIRRLTPLECFRLQGFPDAHYHNARQAGMSDHQLYKQAGNAVTVNVVYEIAKRIREIEK